MDNDVIFKKPNIEGITTMKKTGHPKYYDAVIKCACGNEIKTGSTVKSLAVEICSSCHPFYTGKQKIMDSAGRVEKFKQKYKLK